MAIPRHRDPVPPPLPPPQYLPELSTGSDPGWQWANDPRSEDYGRPAAVKPGSSLLGGFHRPLSRSERDVHMEDGHDRLQGERRLEHAAVHGSSQAYDKQLLSRIGGPSTPRKQSLPGIEDLDRRRLALPSMNSPRMHEHRRQGSTEEDMDRSPSSDDIRGAKRRASSPPYEHERYPNASLSTASSISARASLVSSIGTSATSYASEQVYPARDKGSFLCECCPKKPKKFETAEDLKTHESEKQYACSYCSNRFKNKNEAERHQNSLHLRRHSWSCAALTRAQAAFHLSANGTADVCGFCGQEYSNPPDWTARTAHLTQAHKFGQCNQAKKFFRADHFRQHLKHSHDGTSGKWTNMLESACMKDEPPPPKITSDTAIQFAAEPEP